MLQILTYSQEIIWHGIIEKELLNIRPYRGIGILGAILQATSVTDFGVENLTGGESLIPFNEVDKIIRYLVIRAPRNVFCPIRKYMAQTIDILSESLTVFCDEYSRGLLPGNTFNGKKISEFITKWNCFLLHFGESGIGLEENFKVINLDDANVVYSTDLMTCQQFYGSCSLVEVISE